jgi:hypothetical protein
MKRCMSGIFAIVLAVLFSSFTAKTSTDYYLVYKQWFQGAENWRASYEWPTLMYPWHEPGTGRINWLKVTDWDDDNYIDYDEFGYAFSIYNQTNPTAMLLSDESDITDELDVMSIPE